MKRANLSLKQSINSLFSSFLSILVGLLIGILIMLISSLFSSADALSGISLLFKGPFSSLDTFRAIGNMIFYTTPLIFTGLSVAIAYKTGCFNIGAPGQFLMGTMCSLLVALSIDCSKNAILGVFVWILALIAGLLAGAIWGAIPGALKAIFGINEVILCIMTNWIAANLVTWVFSSTSNLINVSGGKSGYLITTDGLNTGTPDLGLKNLTHNSYLDIGIFLAIIAAVICWILLNKTTRGFSMRACGLNRYSAKYAGMDEKKNIIFSMALAGGLAALGGALYYLNPGIEFAYSAAYSNLPAYGFNGIAAAMLANSNPLAVILASLFIRYLNAAGSNFNSAGFNQYFADIIIACIIYCAGFSRYTLELIQRVKLKKKKPVSPVLEANITPEELKAILLDDLEKGGNVK